MPHAPKAVTLFNPVLKELTEPPTLSDVEN